MMSFKTHFVKRVAPSRALFHLQAFESEHLRRMETDRLGFATDDCFHHQLIDFLNFFLDSSINRLICEMPNGREKCSSQFPRAQIDVFKSPLLSS